MKLTPFRIISILVGLVALGFLALVIYVVIDTLVTGFDPFKML